MSVVVVGGAYLETCPEPVDYRATLGSGVRAAAMLGSGVVDRVVTVADPQTLNEIMSVLGDAIKVEAIPRSGRIEFAYSTPLGSPRLRKRAEDHAIPMPPVEAEHVLAFGMVEARLPVIRAQIAIVDPQHSLSVDQIATSIKAENLVLIANRSEILELGRVPDLAAATRAVMRRTKAAAVIVKAGALGALIFRADGIVDGVPAFETPRVFPIGSGDVFTAAVAQHYFPGGDLTWAAHKASRRTAGYVATRQLKETTMSDLDPTPTPTVESVEDPPRVYVASSFATPEQRWAGGEMTNGLRSIGGRDVYPLRDVGPKRDTVPVAQADLDLLGGCHAVVVLADTARTGPYFEAGWATCLGIPIVVVSSDLDEDRFTMLRGTGAAVESDMATAAYRAVWSALAHRRGPDSEGGRLMLLSGGLDSAAVACLERPERALFIDYGQRPAAAERTAARAVVSHLGITLDELAIDLASVGSGSLVDQPQPAAAPTEEWFPYRNQHLVTIAAAHAVNKGLGTIILGAVAGDGERHADCTPLFVSMANALVGVQEGCVRVIAPHVLTSPRKLLQRSGLPIELLRQTHSCHTGNHACGSCSGCMRRSEILAAAAAERALPDATSPSAASAATDVSSTRRLGLLKRSASILRRLAETSKARRFS